MARKIEEIKAEMIADKESRPELAAFTSTSTTAIWNLWIYIVATAVNSLEKLFDLFKQMVLDAIASMKPGTPRWYVYMAKKFQYGHNLVAEEDYYDNTGIDDDVVAASKIIAYAAFVEEPFVRMKVAKKVGSDLAPLDNTELTAFVAYVRRFKYAGVDLNANTITSTIADNLKTTIRIKYNPLVLDENGARLDGSNATPVKDAVKLYLQNLDFNGEFSTQKLIDQIQKVTGVTDLSIDSISTQYGALPFTPVNIRFIPDSGYLIISDANLTIIYEPA